MATLDNVAWSGGFIKPTKRPVYVQKKTTSAKAKVTKSATVSPVIVHAGSSDSSSGGPGEYQYVIRGKSSGNKQKDKPGDCACANCKKGSGKNPGANKAHIIVRSDSRKHCVCNGRGKDRWLCDACRATQKKKGVMKILSAASTSDSGSCCCGGCASEDSKARFEREVDKWMKESKQKMKMKNARVVCNCKRAGCNVCVIVQR